MIRLLEKMVTLGGPQYNAGELYAGPHEAWAVKQGIGEMVETGEAGPEEPAKSPSQPPHDKMVKHARQRK